MIVLWIPIWNARFIVMFGYNNSYYESNTDADSIIFDGVVSIINYATGKTLFCSIEKS